MRDLERRQFGWLWLARWLLPLGLGLLPCLAGAQGQHDAAVAAMRPADVSAPALTNSITAAGFGRVDNTLRKRVLRDAARLAAAPPTPGPAPTPAAPETPPPTPETAPTPEPGAARPPNVRGPVPGPNAKPLPMENPDQVRLQADELRTKDGAAEASGHVEVRYQDITIHSFTGSLDKDRVWGAFEGDVKLEAKLYSADAAQLRINLDTEEFSARQAAAKVDPEYFQAQAQILAPIYVRGTEVVGRPERVVATEGVGTSCDVWPQPHWMLRSERITLVPDERVVFQRPALYLFGNMLFRYPWDLTLSLRRRDNRFLPEVGKNDVEGYYAKFAYGYTLNDENYGVLRLNLTQRRGIGVGFDHTLDAGKQYAELSVFSEPSQGSLTARLMHRGQYSDLLSSSVTMSLQENSGYGATSQSLSGDLTLRYDTRQAHTSLGLQRSELSSGVNTSQRSSSTMSHRQQIGTTGDWELRTNYTSSSFSSGQAADQELTTEFTWRQDFHAFSASLAANRRFDMDGSRYTGDSNYYSLNRLPDFSMTTDSGRLGNFKVLGSRFNSTLYLGYFDQQPNDIQSYRAGMDFSLPDITYEFGEVARLRTSARFRQMFYTDAAQWVADAQTEYRLTLPASWETRVTFNYSHPEGFTPVRTDYASPAASMYFEAVRLVSETMRVNLTCGRDFENGYYQDAIFRGEFMLSPRNRVELQSGYSLQNSLWRPINLRWIFATQRTWWSAVTLNYDVDQTNLTNVSFDLDWTPDRKWRVQFLGGYTQYGGLDQADVRVTRDLHCMLAQISYSKTTGEVSVGLGIKAFPSATRTFGVGSRGQQFESNFGDTY